MREECVTDDPSLSTDEELQETLCEVLYLRARLAQSQERNELLASQLTGTNDSRGVQIFRLLQSCRSAVMPTGSRRERLGMAGFDAIGGAARKTMLIWQVLATRLGGARAGADYAKLAMRHKHSAVLPSWRLSSNSLAILEERPRSSRTQAVSPLSVDKHARAIDDRLDTIPFSPSSWQLLDQPAPGSSSINLAIVSLLHRSGSTLLQRICNARRRTLIWGEHNAMLSRFADIYKGVAWFSIIGSEEREDYFKRGEDPNLWIADMCPELEYVEEATVNSARALLDTLYGQYREWHDVVGFKEVQYGRAEVELLRRCCPEAKILLLVRHPYNTWNSTPRDWYPSFAEWAMLWNTRAREFAALANADPNCYLVRYEDIVRQDARTLEIIAEVAQVTRDEISSVLAHKIGSNHVGISRSERQSICACCRDAMEMLGYEAR